MKISASFTGMLDLDSDDRYIEDGNYRVLENGIIDRDGDGGRFLVKKIKSTKEICELPFAGVFVGGKEYKGFYYSFYYNEVTHILTLYKINLGAQDSFELIFSKKLEDVVIEDYGTSDDELPPVQQPALLYDYFVKMSNGGSYVYLNTPFHSNIEYTSVGGESPGVPFDDINDINQYFRVVNPGTQNAFIICRVPVVVPNGEFNVFAPSGSPQALSGVSGFSSIFTIKNKGQANEYIVSSLPMKVNGDIGVFSSYVFAQGGLLYIDSAPPHPVNPEDPTYKTVVYHPVSRIANIDFIENQATGDLMCFWTDGINQPFSINVSALLRGDDYDLVRSMLNAKIVPDEPTIRFYRDFSFSNVNMKDRCFQFAQRYVYRDGERTPLSSYSQSAFLPSPISTSIGGGVSQGFFVNAGNLYRLNDFDPESSVLVKENIGVNYTEVVSTPDGRIIYVYSRTHNLPILRSFDYGITFENGASRRFISQAAISEDGRYIYGYASGLFVSSDFGATFTNKGTASTQSAEAGVKCSRDGQYVIVQYQFDVIITNDQSEFVDRRVYYRGFVVGAYGNTQIAARERIVSIGQFATVPVGCAGAISESGKNITFFLHTERHVSLNNGQVFSVQTNPALVRAAAVYDNGFGLADGFISFNSFGTVSAHTVLFGRVWEYSNIIIVREGAQYSKVDFSGAVLDSKEFIAPPYFLSGESVRDVVSNIENAINVVDIILRKPNPLVKKVELVAIDSNSGIAYIIGTILNESIPDDGMVFNFRNDKIYRVLSDTEKRVLYSNVPLRAKSQSLINGRLFYGNYIDGRNINPIDMNISPITFNPRGGGVSAEIENETTLSLIYNSQIVDGDVLIVPVTYRSADGVVSVFDFFCVFSRTYVNIEQAIDAVEAAWLTLFPLGTVNAIAGGLVLTTGDSVLISIGDVVIKWNGLSYLRGHNINIGIVYKDEYGRGSFPLFSQNPININTEGNVIEKFRVEIRHTPPVWANTFKFVRTDRDLSYNIISGFKYAKVDRGLIYLMKFDNDIYMPNTGDSLLFFTESGRQISLSVESKVIKEADFVDGSPVGEWIALKAPSVPGYSAQDVGNNTHRYGSTVFYAKSPLEVSENILFYEIPGEYRLRDGYHSGNIQGQTDTIPAIIDIVNDGNVFHIEGLNIDIMSLSGGRKFFNGGRALIEIENVSEINNYDAVTWSDSFVQDTGDNGLSMFNLGLVNFKRIGAEFGEINAIRGLDTNLHIWQDHRLGYLLVDKDAITTSSGAQVVGRSDAVVGEFVSYSGRWGSMHALSISTHGGVRYFVDAYRAAVCQVGQEGVTEISNRLIASELKRIIKPDGEYLSVFNRDLGEYWLWSRDENKVFVFNIANKGWVRTMTSFDVDGLFSEGKRVFSVVGNKLHAQMSGDDYGVIHGNQSLFRFEYSANDVPGVVKVVDAIELESNRPIKTMVYIGGSYNSGESHNASIINDVDFEFREGEYEAFVSGANNVTIEGVDGVIQPISTIKEVDGSIAIFSEKEMPTISTANHAVFVVADDASPEFRGNLNTEGQVGINSIAGLTNLSQLDVGKLVFLVEKSYLNGHKLRAPFFRVRFDSEDSEPFELFASRLRVKPSNNE